MRNRKVYGLLSLLSEAEQTRFSEFLISPLFEPSRTLQRFFHLWQEKILAPDRTTQTPTTYDAETFLEGSKRRESVSNGKNETEREPHEGERRDELLKLVNEDEQISILSPTVSD